MANLAARILLLLFRDRPGEHEDNLLLSDGVSNLLLSDGVSVLLIGS